MKKFLSVFAVIVLFFFASCKETPTVGATPGEVAVSLFSAITTGKADVVKENIHITDTIQRDVFNDWIDMAVSSEQYKENTAVYNPTYNIAEESIDGDNAKVVLTCKEPSGQQVRITVKLLKIDGRWKVDGDHGVWH